MCCAVIRRAFQRSGRAFDATLISLWRHSDGVFGNDHWTADLLFAVNSFTNDTRQGVAGEWLLEQYCVRRYGLLFEHRGLAIARHVDDFHLWPQGSQFRG